jgi:DNA-binding IscR family transcriptional regulator
MEQELNVQQKAVLDLIRKGYKNKVNIGVIAKVLGLSKRQIVYIISELREYYPICSTTLEGGGVWIADCNKDITNFVKKMQKLRDHHQLTINYMEAHIK